MATHLKLLLVAFFASLMAFKHSHCANVFLSIDCGSSESYTDENGIEWTRDDAYIQNRDNKTVAYPSLVPYPMSTMRVFSTRKKNCYSIKVDEGERVLVRASFYYGNYDRKNSPPVFDLQFDGNFWTTVNTSLRSYDVLSYEAIYVVKRNFTSICAAQTKPGQLPFISAIEVRSLGINMYSQVPSNLALHLIQRAALGANQTIIRYPDDAYDRTWNGAYGFGLSEVASQALSINITTNNSPPTAVLKNAVVSASTSHIIILFTDLPAKPIPVYIATYFSEVLLLNPTQKRSFQLCIDDKPFSDPIIPPFASASEAYVTNRIASASNSFTLQATSDSTLPPLVNAMEIYTVSNPLTNGTNVKDVEGLAVLQSGLKVLQEWSGDPCLPSPYTWDWVQCSFDLIPRITALNLSGYSLSGSLRDFSSMDSLQTIDLSDNSFSGNIPEFLGTLPNLTLLNLAGNRFNGTIPTKLSSNKQLKLVVTGNCLNGMSCPHQSPPPLPKEAPSPSSPTDTENKTPPTTPFPFQNEAPPTPSSTRTETEAEAEAPPVVFQRPSFTGNSDSMITNKLAMILGAIIQFSLVLAVLSKNFNHLESYSCNQNNVLAAGFVFT